MNKKLIRILIIFIGLLLLGGSAMYLLKLNTKKHSPEETVTHKAKDATFSVYYNRPFKKNRTIFGKLVPFGKVWRTGANEATTFTTNKDIMIDGSTLAAGTYTLWTIPNPASWKVIFNKKEYSWGVSMGGEVKREPDFDALTIEVPTQPLLNSIDQFSIYFENANDFTLFYLAWDRTAVAIPIKI